MNTWEGENREGNKPQETLNDRELKVDGGRWVGNGLDGDKESTYYEEHWVLCVSDKSLNSAETNITLYVS